MIRGLPPRFDKLRKQDLVLPLALAVVVYALTAIPYVLAYARTPPGTIFDGILIWPADQGAYASFIRQAADGHWLFVNRLTCVEHAPAYFNLEWLLVGRLMAGLDGSTDWTYQIWRAAGAVSVACGFYALARVVLQRELLRRVALLMCLFGGGFHALSLVINRLFASLESLLGVQLGRLSAVFEYFTIHPFAQILVNPHFALPLGIFMLAVAAFLRGERTGSWRWYAAAGVLCFLEGLMRPYELIALYSMVPVFIVVEAVVVRRIEWRRAWLRALPLVIALPVLGYTVFIFAVHPVFKYWASQGYVRPISFLDNLAHLGLVGVLVGIRLCLVKKYPFASSTERLLLTWAVVVFFFVHSNSIPWLSFMPYTPQLMTSLMPPLILLAIVVVDPAGWSAAARRPALAMGLIVLLVGIHAADSAVLLRRFSPARGPGDRQYVPATEMQAYRWLDREAAEDDVVLCVIESAHRLAKYASVRLVSGHWSVTPQSEQVEGLAQRFYRGALPPRVAAELLQRWRVRWIFFGPRERELGQLRGGALTGFTEHVINEDVTIYSRDG